MKDIKDIAEALGKGDVKKASDIRESLLHMADPSLELEAVEVAKQAIINHLKKGRVDVAKEIGRSFPMPQELFDETVQQAILSSICDGDMGRVKALKSELPISRELGLKIAAYCASWERRDRIALMESVFA